MTLRIIYIKLSQASILIPVFAGIANYRRLTPSLRLLLYFFLATIGFEVQASILGKVYHNNMPGLHLFTFVEFLLFSTVYLLFFWKHRILSLLIGFNMLVFTIAALADAFFIHDIWTINTLSRSYSSAAMLCYTLVYFYFMFSKDETRYSMKYPMFWVNAGVLVYFGSNILYFMFNEDLMARGSVASFFGLGVHATLNIIANYLYAQSFRCFKQKVVS